MRVGGRGGMRKMSMPESAALLGKGSVANNPGRDSEGAASAIDIPRSVKHAAANTSEAREPPPARQLMRQSPIAGLTAEVW